MEEHISAILWDYQNVRHVDEVLGFKEEIVGSTPILKAYIDSMTPVEKIEQMYRANFELIIIPMYEKNLADQQIITDAMEINRRYPEITRYFIVTGDNDFLPLVRKLQAQGKWVEIVANPIITSKQLREEADLFTSVKPTRTKNQQTQVHTNGKMNLNEAISLLEHAFSNLNTRKAPLAAINEEMKKIDPKYKSAKHVLRNGKPFLKFKDLVKVVERKGKFIIVDDNYLMRINDKNTNKQLTITEAALLLRGVHNQLGGGSISFEVLDQKLRETSSRYNGVTSVTGSDGNKLEYFSQLALHMTETFNYVINADNSLTEMDPRDIIFFKLKVDDWKIIFETLEEQLMTDEVETFKHSLYNLRYQLNSLRKSEIFSFHITIKQLERIIHKIIKEGILDKEMEGDYKIYSLPQDYRQRWQRFIGRFRPDKQVNSDKLTEFDVKEGYDVQDNSEELEEYELLDKQEMLDVSINKLEMLQDQNLEDQIYPADDDSDIITTSDTVHISGGMLANIDQSAEITNELSPKPAQNSNNGETVGSESTDKKTGNMNTSAPEVLIHSIGGMFAGYRSGLSGGEEEIDMTQTDKVAIDSESQNPETINVRREKVESHGKTSSLNQDEDSPDDPLETKKEQDDDEYSYYATFDDNYDDVVDEFDDEYEDFADELE